MNLERSESQKCLSRMGVQGIVIFVGFMWLILTVLIYFRPGLIENSEVAGLLMTGGLFAPIMILLGFVGWKRAADDLEMASAKEQERGSV